jgi:hypothetical protein
MMTQKILYFTVIALTSSFLQACKKAGTSGSGSYEYNSESGQTSGYYGSSNSGGTTKSSSTGGSTTVDQRPEQRLQERRLEIRQLEQHLDIQQVGQRLGPQPAERPLEIRPAEQLLETQQVEQQREQLAAAQIQVVKVDLEQILGDLTIHIFVTNGIFGMLDKLQLNFQIQVLFFLRELLALI